MRYDLFHPRKTRASNTYFLIHKFIELLVFDLSCAYMETSIAYVHTHILYMRTYFTFVLCTNMWTYKLMDGWVFTPLHTQRRTSFMHYILIHTFIHACMLHNILSYFGHESKVFCLRKIELTRREGGRGNLADTGNAEVVRKEELLHRHGTFGRQSHPCMEWTGHLSPHQNYEIRFDDTSTQSYVYTFSLAHGITHTQHNTRRRNYDNVWWHVSMCQGEKVCYTFNGVTTPCNVATV